MPAGKAKASAASVYEHFHSPYSEHNRFLNGATQVEKHFLRDFKRYHPYTTKHGNDDQADSCNDCPRCGEPDDCSGRPLPAEVEVYPDLYPPESKPLNYPLVVCNSPVQADIATGLPLTLQDATEDWRQCRVCMYKIPVKNSIIKGFMRPPHQDYHHYKYYGFGGKGAKTSWAHNPKFKMLGVLPADDLDQLREFFLNEPAPLQKVVGGIRRCLTPIEKKLIKEFRRDHSYPQSPKQTASDGPTIQLSSEFVGNEDKLGKIIGAQEGAVDLATKKPFQHGSEEQADAWRVARVVTYKHPAPEPGAFKDKGAPSHGAQSPFYHRYKHYKYNGFAGEGAKTSWGRNPKMAKLYD